MSTSPVDARVRLTLLFVWTLGLFGIASPVVLALLVVGSFLLAVAEGVDVRRIARSLVTLSAVLLILVAGAAVRFDGTGDATLVGAVGVSLAGLAAGGCTVMRIVAMVGMCLAAAGRAGYGEMLDALVDLLSPLRRLHVPVDELAAIAAMALRFIPVVRAEFDRVACAQRARGAGVGRGGPWERVVSWVPVFVPLLVGLFRRSEDLSVAMCARRWRPDGGTRMRERHIRRRDWVLLAAGIAVCAVVVALF